MRVELALMARPGTKAITKIYSQPRAVRSQPRLAGKHYPQAEQVIVESTSEAAALAAKEKGTAAIAGAQAVKQNGLKIISGTWAAKWPTRPLSSSWARPWPARRRRRTPASFLNYPTRRGVLSPCCKLCRGASLNLTKILSRPIPGRFEEYRFMIEFLGAAPKKEVADALAKVRKLTDFLAVIGSYPVRRI